uniref:Uncharacterized protein n=1 Tax=Caenorhabditis tropicalis TaxID=1561998 RepID=A0A1I7UI34_9PELO
MEKELSINFLLLSGFQLLASCVQMLLLYAIMTSYRERNEEIERQKKCEKKPLSDVVVVNESKNLAIEQPKAPTDAHKEFIEKKKSAEKEWEPETRYRNQGTVFIKSQNVSAADVSEERGRSFNYSNLCLIVVRSRTRRTGERSRSEEKKRGGGGISKVKWSDDPIVFYEIGDDFDRFEGMDNDVTVGSSSVMTASIKEI